MGSARILLAVAALAACAVPGVSGSQAADMPAQGSAMRDPIMPTVPRGFAADLPRSPLVDGIVDGRYRFSSLAVARRQCPDDDVVVVEPFSTTYLLATAEGPGPFMCKAAALQEGDLPR
jgi:hypothetical protein